MKQFLMILVCLGMIACSSLRRTITYSALSGAMAGAASGVALSPNKKSNKGNALIFGLATAVLAAGVGYALYQDDPRNYQLKHMLLGQSTKLDINLGTFNINAKLDKKEAYSIPVKKLPAKLKGIVNQQYLIKHRSKERVIKQRGRTFYIPAFEAYEHSYGKGIFNGQ